MARTDPQFNLRMPQGLKDQIDEAALRSNRSINAEIVLRLQQSFLNDSSVTPLEIMQKAEHFLAETMAMRSQVEQQLEKLTALLEQHSAK